MMRLSTIASIAGLAVSTAAIAQVTGAPMEQKGAQTMNNTMSDDSMATNTTANTATSMPDNGMMPNGMAPQ
jgi:hypothetical protein